MGSIGDVADAQRLVFQVVKVGLIESGPSPTGEVVAQSVTWTRGDWAADNAVMFVLGQKGKRAWR